MWELACKWGGWLRLNRLRRQAPTMGVAVCWLGAFRWAWVVLQGAGNSTALQGGFVLCGRLPASDGGVG